MILSSLPGGHMPGGCWLRALLEAHHHVDLGAERLLVELERLFAAAVEEQIGLTCIRVAPCVDPSRRAGPRTGWFETCSLGGRRWNSSPRQDYCITSVTPSWLRTRRAAPASAPGPCRRRIP
jgi:hypothetical protein